MYIDAGNPKRQAKAAPVDIDTLTEEDEALRAALLIDSSETCESGEAWSLHYTWQVMIR